MAKKLEGKFRLGFALDMHVLYSKPIDLENKIFDTQRSEIGQLVYEIKYKDLETRDKWDIIENLAQKSINFLQNMYFTKYIDVIVPVPPNKKRDIQHVIEIAKIISDELDIDIDERFIEKTRDIVQIKDIEDKRGKEKILDGVYKLKDSIRHRNKNILLFDDIYDTGATCEVISTLLYNEGKVKDVYILTLTKTKR